MLRASYVIMRRWWTKWKGQRERLYGHVLTIIGCSLALYGCVVVQPIAYETTTSTACERSAPRIERTSFPQQEHIPLPIDMLEDKLRDEPFTIIKAHSTPHGTTSAMRLTIQFGDCSVMQVKWRAAPRRGDAYNNSPRKELAAYTIQKLYLEPQDYVVPVTVAVCIPQEELAKIGARATPQLAGTTCAWGTLMIWIDNVKLVRMIWDPERFERSLASHKDNRYAWHFANLNLLTYLINHLDGRKSNFLMSNHPDSLRLFSVDNGLSFSGIGNPLPWVPRWNKLRVPKLPRDSVMRLQRLTRAQLYRRLGTVVEFRMTQDGHLSPASHVSNNLNPKEGIRVEGRMMQIGLRQKEIAQIEDRLNRLLQRIEAGEIPLFF